MSMSSAAERKLTSSLSRSGTKNLNRSQSVSFATENPLAQGPPPPAAQAQAQAQAAKSAAAAAKVKGQPSWADGLGSSSPPPPAAQRGPPGMPPDRLPPQLARSGSRTGLTRSPSQQKGVAVAAPNRPPQAASARGENGTSLARSTSAIGFQAVPEPAKAQQQQRPSRSASNTNLNSSNSLSRLPSGQWNSTRKSVPEPEFEQSPNNVTMNFNVTSGSGGKGSLKQAIRMAPSRGASKTKKSTVAAKAALNGKNEFYGTGQQMEPEKWRRWKTMVEKNKFGAHYDWVCEPLAADTWEKDSERDMHDMAKAEVLHNRRPSDPVLSNGEELRQAAGRVAFPDRAGRLREGRGVRKVLMSGDPPQKTEWIGKKECACDVCNPFDSQPAGNPSHLTAENKVHDCMSTKHVGPTFVESSTYKDSVGPTLQGNFQDSKEEEQWFRTMLGVKVRSPKHHRTYSPYGNPGGPDLGPGANRLSSPMLLHRSMSADNLVAAGQYRSDYCHLIMTGSHGRGRQSWSVGTPRRNGMAMVLDPQASDPPPPNTIVASRRGEGIFKDTFSEAAEKATLRQNQQVLRFADPRTIRCRSFSPPRSGDHAGMTSAQLVRWRDRESGVAPDLHARPPVNDSILMDHILNHEATQKIHRAESAERFRTDPAFKDICQYTKQHHEQTRKLLSELNPTYKRSDSGKVKAHLAWIED